MNPQTARWLRVAAMLTMLALVVPALATDALAQDAGTPVAAVTEEVWVETTVPAEALPPSGPVFLGLFRIVWEEGAGYRYQEDTPGIAVDCVVSGELTLRNATPGPAGSILSPW